MNRASESVWLVVSRDVESFALLLSPVNASSCLDLAASMLRIGARSVDVTIADWQLATTDEIHWSYAKPTRRKRAFARASASKRVGAS